MAGLRTPLSTLHVRPHDRPHMTRGRGGSLLLHRNGLAVHRALTVLFYSKSHAPSDKRNLPRQAPIAQGICARSGSPARVCGLRDDRPAQGPTVGRGRKARTACQKGESGQLANNLGASSGISSHSAKGGCDARPAPGVEIDFPRTVLAPRGSGPCRARLAEARRQRATFQQGNRGRLATTSCLSTAVSAVAN
jgi:hypothetical protein